MILGFSTIFPKGNGKLSGKPTRFVEKIFKGLAPRIGEELDQYYSKTTDYFNERRTGVFLKTINNVEPKIHTLRSTKKRLWKEGTIIDFFINVRTKNMFRFAPKIPAVSVQDIMIKHFRDHVQIFIDSDVYHVFHHGLDDIYEYDHVVKQLALNDGFESLEDFFCWFSEDFEGQIIHWTDFKY